MLSVSRDFTKPYTAAESYFYDAVIAPGVARLAREILEARREEFGAARDVLDVGCGGGHLAVAIAERFEHVRVTGVDLSPEQVGRARQRARSLGARASFVAGSAMSLPLPDASFDLVVSVASIKHWPDPARGVAECVRVLRPGGRLFVTEVDRGCRLEDAERFVRATRVPGPFVPLALPAFRTWVAGRSVDLDDARTWLDGLPVTDASVDRSPGMPVLVVTARRA